MTGLKLYSRTALAILAAFFSLLFVSCAGLPPRPLPRTPAEWLALLPPESTLLGTANGQTTRFFFSDSFPELQDFLERTERIFVAAQLEGGRPPALSFLVLGSYPLSGTRLQLGLSGGFRRKEGTIPFWQQREGSWQVAPAEDGLILVSNGTIERLIARWSRPSADVPSGFPLEMLAEVDRASLLAYFPTFPGPVKGRDLTLPIRELWVAASQEEEALELRGTFLLSAVHHPELLPLLLRVSIAAWLKELGVEEAEAKARRLELEAGDSCLRFRRLILPKPLIKQVLAAFLEKSGVAVAPPVPSVTTSVEYYKVVEPSFFRYFYGNRIDESF